MKNYILLLFFGLTFTLNAQEIKLLVPEVRQQESYWCAVASSQCVLRYFGHWALQCEIMEYVRQATLSYGIKNCCADATQGCNWGIYLYPNKGSVQDVLKRFGSINSIAHEGSLSIHEVSGYLRSNRPLIISWQYYSTFDEHAVVIHGYNSGDIYYMDPDSIFGGFKKISYIQLITGLGIGFCWFDTLIIGDELIPEHCFNCEFDQDLGEEEEDCGGPCPPCYVQPPPPNTCSNCKKDPGEIKIDCGGHCPPCEDVLEEINIVNKIYNYSTEAMAFKKITAGKYGVGIKQGQKVSFITEKEGSIVLLPGFSAERGSNFSTHRWEDLSGYSRICPEELCSTEWFTNKLVGSIPPSNGLWFGIHDLLYAVEIQYTIYDSSGRFIYGDNHNITHNGDVGLWDCRIGAYITEGTETYTIFCNVLFCNRDRYSYIHTFVVTFLPYSINKEPKESETPNTLLSPPSNNIILQDGNISPSFVIIPNPNPGTFQLESNFPLSAIASLKVVDMLGVSVYETKTVLTHTIQLDHAATGLYFVVAILKDGRVLTQKMMVGR